MTDREKIIEIIAPYISAYGDDERIADALIAANIGDVTEWKEKVECAKRILQIPTLPNGTTDLSYFEYKGERIQDIARERDEYKHRAEVAERAYDNIMGAFHELLSAIFPDKKIDLDDWKKDNLTNAEKELAEEEKDGKMR